MSRRNFSKQTLARRFESCGGRCEGITPHTGIRCNVVLVKGRWAGDHDNPDGLTGEPTFENCRCLCLDCHALKTKGDRKSIAQAQRRQAADLGIKPEPTRKIPQRAKAERPKREQVPVSGVPEIARRFGVLP